MIRILHIVSTLGTGSGVMSVLMRNHRHIDRSKVQFDYLSFRQTDVTFEAEVLALGGKVYHFPRPSLKAGFQKKLDAFFAEHAGEYAAVHCHPIYASVIFGKSARNHGVGHVIQHSHSTQLSETLPGKVRNFTMLCIFGRRATDFAACSEAAKKMFFWKKPEDIYLMRNAIDVDKFIFSPEKRESLRSALGIVTDTPLLGHVGRFTKQKNHTFLIQVFAEVLKLRPDAKLLLLGDGVLLEPIRVMCSQMGMEDSVIFAGRQTDVAGYMSAMDIFMLPSLFEGLPIVLVEAQANGIPCLAADTITPESDVTRTVSFLSLENKEAWASKAMTLVTDNSREQNDLLTAAGYNIAVEATNLASHYASLK